MLFSRCLANWQDIVVVIIAILSPIFIIHFKFLALNFCLFKLSSFVFSRISHFYDIFLIILNS